MAPPVPLYLQGERPPIAAAQSHPEANLMPDTYTIDAVSLWILSGLGGLLLLVAGWVARAFWKRQDQQDKRMDRDRAEVLDLIKQAEKRSEERFRATTAQFEKQDKKIDGIDKKGEERHRETQAWLDKKIDGIDKKGEERHRETQARIHDLTYSVGRLDGVAGVKDGPGARSGQSSPRRNNNPAPPPDREPDPVPVAERHDRSMVPLAGVRPAPAVPAGMAGQAVPGQHQTTQLDGEAESEPPAEESPDSAP